MRIGEKSMSSEGFACHMNDVNNCISSLQDSATGQSQSNDISL